MIGGWQGVKELTGSPSNKTGDVVGVTRGRSTSGLDIHGAVLVAGGIVRK
jgi:hypothetical protein